MDQGVHEVRLLVTVGAAESVRLSLPGLANWLNAPPIAYAHLPIGSFIASGETPQIQFSLEDFKQMFSIQPENISLLACKRSWDGEALILRLQESSGLKTKVTAQLEVPEIQINLSFRPLEIKTVRIEKTGQWAEVALIDEK
jgi:alpha-mannosidase